MACFKAAHWGSTLLRSLAPTGHNVVNKQMPEEEKQIDGLDGWLDGALGRIPRRHVPARCPEKDKDARESCFHVQDRPPKGNCKLPSGTRVYMV